MDAPNECEDELYQVPMSCREISLPAVAASAVPDEVPPALMPKRLSGFQRTSSLLERQFPNSTPHPPPRSSRGTPKENKLVQDKTENIADHGSVSQLRTSKSLDLTEPHPFKANEDSISKQTAKTTPSTKPLPAIPKASQTMPTNISSKNVPASVNKDKDITASQPFNHTTGNISATRPVPKPRPRTKAVPTAPQILALNSSTQQAVVISDSEHSDSKQQASVIKNHKVIELPSETSVGEEQLPSLNYSLPLDADSIELMLNDEVDKKYGLNATENKHPVPNASSQQLSVNEEYVNPDELKIVISDSVPPQPHSTGHTFSYLHMTNESQNRPILASQPPSHLQIRASSPALVPKLDIGLDLFAESSSDDILEPTESSDEKLNASACLSITTPKPFNDIKPFKSFKSASILPSESPVKPKHQETKTPILDFSDFDPLWSGKPKIAQSSNITQKDKINFSDGKKTVYDFATDFNLLTDSGTDMPSSTYATADDVYSEDHYSQIEKESKNKITAVPRRSLSSRESFHHEAPIAPPPPLPRQQNRIPEPRPPPVPPRPDNALVTAHPPSTRTSPSPPSTLPCPASASTNIFNDLPTPGFLQTQISDPFQDSNFDYECLKFNKTQVPTPPSRSPIPKTPTLQTEKSSNEAATDSRLDPGRISRFVIPPPGCPLNDTLNTDDYDLARGKCSCFMNR